MPVHDIDAIEPGQPLTDPAPTDSTAAPPADSAAAPRDEAAPRAEDIFTVGGVRMAAPMIGGAVIAIPATKFLMDTIRGMALGIEDDISRTAAIFATDLGAMLIGGAGVLADPIREPQPGTVDMDMVLFRKTIFSVVGAEGTLYLIDDLFQTDFITAGEPGELGTSEAITQSVQQASDAFAAANAGGTTAARSSTWSPQQGGSVPVTSIAPGGMVIGQ